jgi:hypothetical protein
MTSPARKSSIGTPTDRKDSLSTWSDADGLLTMTIEEELNKNTLDDIFDTTKIETNMLFRSAKKVSSSCAFRLSARR